jgi:hypothetical protein
MKKTNKKNSKMRKLLPAFAMLTVSAISLSSATYAWFTMNKEVEVTGLTLRTKVSSNLLLSENNVEGTYAPDRLISGRKALLEPVSSVSGQTGSFYYTLDAKESGEKAHSASSIAYAPYSEAKADIGTVETPKTNTNATAAAAGKYYFDNTFSKAYGVEPSEAEFGTAYGYVDYVFYLKATGDTDGQQLVMTNCDLNYTYPSGVKLADGTTAVDANVDQAWRVAVFASDITTNGGKGNSGASGSAADTVGKLDPATSAAKTILAPSGADNWTDNKAVSGPSAIDTVTYGTKAVLDNSINAGVTKYYKVLVRIWLEGEDESCNSETYAKLTSDWSLDLEFKLENDNTNAVDVLTQNGFAPDITNTKDMANSPVDVNRSEET